MIAIYTVLALSFVSALAILFIRIGEA